MNHLLAVVLALQAPAPASDSLTIRFIGNAAFVLSDGATTLVTDFPYHSGAFGYMEYDWAASAPPGEVVSVITHRHDDHWHGGRFAGTAWHLVGPGEIAGGLPADRIRALGERVTIGAFEIIPLVTPHRDTEHYSYLIQWRGRRLYFTGDTEDPSRLLGTTGLDLAFVTSWLACAVDRRGDAIDAARIVLHHQYPDRRTRPCLDVEEWAQGESTVIGPAR